MGHIFIDIIKAIKIKQDGTESRLCDLVSGDNLECNGRREIANYAENYRGLHIITTVRIESGSMAAVIQRYFATDEMLQNGELFADGKPKYEIPYRHQQFFDQHLIRQQPVEVLA